MVKSNKNDPVNSNSYRNTINNAIYKNLKNVLNKGTNNENGNPNINTKASFTPKKFKIIENHSELITYSHSNYNIIKNNVNINKDTSVSSSNYSKKFKTKLYQGKGHNKRLSFEILTRIFILCEDPKAFSLVCKQWYHVTKETSSKLLWFINRIPKEIICIYLFTHPIYHVHFDANFLKILIKHGAKLDLHFFEQAIPILLKNKSGITNGKELGVPSISYFQPKLERKSKINESTNSQPSKTNSTSIRDTYNNNNNNLFRKRLNSLNCNENNTLINKYLNDSSFKSNLMNYYSCISHYEIYDYHYNSNLLPIFLFLYQKTKKQYINLVESINSTLKYQLTNATNAENNRNHHDHELNTTFLIEDYQPIVSINESINLFLNNYKNETLIPMAILESMFSSNSYTFDSHETIIKTVTHFYNEIKNNFVILPILKRYIHHLVYNDHFIPYNIIQKPYNTRQIRDVLQFMEIIWLLEPEIIFTWIKWGWGDVDGQIPLVIFSAYYDCRTLINERVNNQLYYERIQNATSSSTISISFPTSNSNSNSNSTTTSTSSSTNNSYHNRHAARTPPPTKNSFSTDTIHERVRRINESQKSLLDYMVEEENLHITNETLNFIDSNMFNCPCYNILGHSTESPCTLKRIIKYWKLSNDNESKRKLVRKLVYNAWTRKDGVGLYKMEYYLKSFNKPNEILLNINEFIMEMITLDPVVIFKQDMLGWIINHSSSQSVKKLILYTLFNTLPKDPQRIHMVKLILNFVGDIDLKAIELLKNIDKNNRVWEQLYSILIIHLYRRYVRRRMSIDTELCNAWADLFNSLEPQKYELTSVQTRFQDELFELLEVY